MLKNFISKCSGNKYAQKLLEKNILFSLNLSGVGSGGGVQNSGEKSVLNLIESIAEPYIIFDVGANKGEYLNMVLNEFQNKDFVIHSFEPSKFTFDRLQKNAPVSEKIKLNNLGLGKNIGEHVLYSDKEGSGLASLTKRKLDHFNIDFSESEKIQITSLDNYCLENSINHLHLLKIDVEGHELDVLNGASKMFATHSIDIVTFEFGGCNIDTRSFFQDFYYYFQDKKMQLFRITPSGYLFPIEKYKEQYEQFITTNFAAVNIELIHNGG